MKKRKRLFVEHEQVLLSFMKRINKENYLDVFSEMYKYVKSITNDYCLYDGTMHDSYYDLLNCLLVCEENFYGRKSLLVPVDLDFYDEDNFIDRLVYNTRNCLITDLVFEGFRGKLSDIDFTDKCVIASKYVRNFCEEDGISNYNLEIYPGYDANEKLFDGSGYHFANIIKYNGEYYLVDVTYPQFFYDVRGNLDRLGIVDFSCCNVGAFVLMDEERVNVAITLLRDGYIKLDEKVFKAYLDSFTISFRNGLFYEDTEDFSYTTSYSIEDYIKFLTGEDNQIGHEGRENLGYQKIPLRNSQLDFRKR